MMRLFYFLFFIVLLVFQGCKTDFDINAEYKDITIVYGLLNQNDSIHYIRINKAFLGEESALIMAQDPANSIYPYDELDVVVEEWLNDNLTNTYALDTVQITNKEPGVFYNSVQVMYAFAATLNENAIYKLKIQNTVSGKLIEAETPIVNDFQYEKPYVPPVPPPPQIYKLPSLSFIGTSPVTLEWYSGKFGKRYQVSMFFNYLDMTPSDTIQRQLEWKLGNEKAEDLDGDEKMRIDIVKESFFIKLKDNIPYIPGIHRRALYLDFVFSVAGNEFNTYMEVNEPSTNLIQEKPEYTNISNGIGLFCSRYVKDFVSLTDQRPIRFQLNPQSLTELKTGEHTNLLGFVD